MIRQKIHTLVLNDLLVFLVMQVMQMIFIIMDISAHNQETFKTIWKKCIYDCNNSETTERFRITSDGKLGIGGRLILAHYYQFLLVNQIHQDLLLKVLLMIMTSPLLSMRMVMEHTPCWVRMIIQQWW